MSAGARNGLPASPCRQEGSRPGEDGNVRAGPAAPARPPLFSHPQPIDPGAELEIPAFLRREAAEALDLPPLPRRR